VTTDVGSWKNEAWAGCDGWKCLFLLTVGEKRRKKLTEGSFDVIRHTNC